MTQICHSCDIKDHRIGHLVQRESVLKNQLNNLIVMYKDKNVQLEKLLNNKQAAIDNLKRKLHNGR